MTALDAAHKLVKQDGACEGIPCHMCPIYCQNISSCDGDETEATTNAVVVKQAHEYIGWYGEYVAQGR